eukprot:15433630-Alexandrium_andersonii.AAC.1
MAAARATKHVSLQRARCGRCGRPASCCALNACSKMVDGCEEHARNTAIAKHGKCNSMRAAKLDAANATSHA